jgi:hypothetical protein
MQCQACEYENPRGAKVCLECGAGLRGAARKKAEARFKDALTSTRQRAAERLERASFPDENANRSLR